MAHEHKKEWSADISLRFLSPGWASVQGSATVASFTLTPEQLEHYCICEPNTGSVSASWVSFSELSVMDVFLTLFLGRLSYWGSYVGFTSQVSGTCLSWLLLCWAGVLWLFSSRGPWLGTVIWRTTKATEPSKTSSTPSSLTLSESRPEEILCLIISSCCVFNIPFVLHVDLPVFLKQPWQTQRSSIWSPSWCCCPRWNSGACSDWIPRWTSSPPPCSGPGVTSRASFWSCSLCLQLIPLWWVLVCQPQQRLEPDLSNREKLHPAARVDLTLTWA